MSDSSSSNERDYQGHLLESMLQERLQNGDDISEPTYEPWKNTKSDIKRIKSDEKFSFKRLFGSINDTVNQANPHTDNIEDIIGRVKAQIKHTPAKKFLIRCKRHLKNWHKSKNVGKFLKHLSRINKDFDHKIDTSASDEVKKKMFGAVLMTAARGFVSPSAYTKIENTTNVKLPLPEEPCASGGDEIDDDYFKCSECSDYFLCYDCEEDDDHEHVLFKIKLNKEYKASKNKFDKKPVITNFPVPDSFGRDGSTNQDKNGNNKCISNSEIFEGIDQPNNRNDNWMKSHQTKANRPAIIEAPEEVIIGKPGTFVVADFIIQNKSKHMLPKKLFLKKLSKDDVQYDTILDEDALEPDHIKQVSIPMLLPNKTGEYRGVFSYFNINSKKMGGDFIVTVISRNDE